MARALPSWVNLPHCFADWLLIEVGVGSSSMRAGMTAAILSYMSVDNQSYDRDLIFVESVDHPQRRGVPG